MIALLAMVATFLLLCLGVLQVFLALGFPAGEYAWGGQSKVLSVKMRIASVVSIGLYAFFALILLTSADIVEVEFIEGYFVWVLAGYFLLGTFMNAVSRSRKEQRVMTPVALVLFLITALLALQG